MRAALVTLILILTALTAPPAQAQDGTPTTTFSAQASGGHSVMVESVNMPEDGFVAVHDATLLQGNVMGSVIGVSEFLAPGAHANLRVYLTRALAGTNETLVAMPHKDTNNNRNYDFISSNGTQDGPFIGGANAIPEASLPAPLQGKGLGGISAVPRAINNTAHVTMHAQTNSGRSVLIAFADLSVPGYIAIHDATLVQGADASGVNPGNVLSSVVGVTELLPAGIHTDIGVRLGNNCAGCKTNGSMNGTLIPMVHKETGGNATRYDFIVSAGTQDGPFTGQPGAPLTAVIDVDAVTFSDVATETFPAQATGGHIVIFPEVFLPDGGYAAVHDATLLEGNVLGSVIGVSSFLPSGIHRNVSVELNFNGSRGVTSSTTLIGMLHKETNKNTVYDFVSSSGTADGPYTGGPNSLSEAQLPAPLKGKGLGGVNAVPAEVTLSAAVRIKPNQPSDGRTIMVDYADFSQRGFVALHDESLLANPGGNVMSSVVGVSAAMTGLTRNVTITLPGSNCAGCLKGALNTSQTLIAMPHKDSNNNSAYDFITSAGAQDGPFTTPASASNTVNALDLNIVVSVGRATVPIGAAPTTTPPAGGTTPQVGTTPPTGTTPANRTMTPQEAGADTPGLGLAAVLVAVSAGALLWRRNRRT